MKGMKNKVSKILKQRSVIYLGRHKSALFGIDSPHPHPICVHLQFSFPSPPFFFSQECGGPIFRGFRGIKVELEGPGGVGAGFWLWSRNAFTFTNKLALSLALFAFVALFFFKACTGKHTAGNTGLLIAFTDQLINPASMNVEACVCVRRLCTSEQLWTFLSPVFLINPRGVVEVNNQIIISCWIMILRHKEANKPCMSGFSVNKKLQLDCAATFLCSCLWMLLGNNTKSHFSTCGISLALSLSYSPPCSLALSPFVNRELGYMASLFCIIITDRPKWLEWWESLIEN